MNIPNMINEKKIPQDSKAGATKISTPEPQEISLKTMITPDP